MLLGRRVAFGSFFFANASFSVIRGIFSDEYVYDFACNTRPREKYAFSALRPESANFPAATRNEVAAFRRRRAEK